MGRFSAGALSLGAVEGVASFSGLVLDEVGADDILQATGSSLAAATTNPITTRPRRLAQLSVSSQPPASITAGKTFGLTVAAEDRFGNVNPSFAGSVTLSLPNDIAGDTLGGTLTMIADAGLARFSDLTLLKTAADDTIEASSDGLGTLMTNPFAVDAAAATQLVVTTQPPADVTAGNGFDLVVEAEDPYGNPDPGFSGVVMLALASPSGGGLLGGTPNLMAEAGVATFTGLALKKAGTDYTLDASSDGVSAATTDPIAVTAAAATQLVVVNQPPQSVTAGSGFGLVALAEDEFGNVDTKFSSIVALASAAGEPVVGTLAVPASAGVAAFTGLTMETAAVGDTLLITTSGLVGAPTSAITVVAAPASQIVVTSTPPSDVTAGSGFGIAVSAEDRYGNVDPNFGGSVMLALAGNPGGTALGGTLAVSASGGVATFFGLTLDRAADGYTLDASSSGLASARSDPIAVNAAQADQLVVSAQPSASVNAGAGFDLTALAVDRFGNIDPQFGGNATLVLANNPGNAALGGIISVSAIDGVATFAGVTISQGGSGYTLVVSAASGLRGSVTSRDRRHPAADDSCLNLVAEPECRPPQEEHGDRPQVRGAAQCHERGEPRLLHSEHTTARKGTQEQGGRARPGELQSSDEYRDPLPPE